MSICNKNQISTEPASKLEFHGEIHFNRLIFAESSERSVDNPEFKCASYDFLKFIMLHYELRRLSSIKKAGNAG
jgi:hypothetical protein